MAPGQHEVVIADEIGSVELVEVICTTVVRTRMFRPYLGGAGCVVPMCNGE